MANNPSQIKLRRDGVFESSVPAAGRDLKEHVSAAYDAYQSDSENLSASDSDYDSDASSAGIPIFSKPLEVDQAESEQLGIHFQYSKGTTRIVDSDSVVYSPPYSPSPAPPNVNLPQKAPSAPPYAIFPPRIRAKTTQGSPRPSTTIQNEPHELHSPRELLTATEIKDSYFEARLNRVEFAAWSQEDDEPTGTADSKNIPACLIVVEINFQPKNSTKSHRFSQATIEMEFTDAPIVEYASHPPQVYRGPRILSFSPTLIAGPESTSTQTVKLSLSASMSASSLVGGLRIPTPAVSPSVSYTSSSPKTGQAIIHGVLRSSPPKRVVWTINENSVEKSGIGRKYKLAVVVGKYQGRFAMKIEVKAKLHGSSLWPVKAGGAGDDPVYFTPEKMANRKIIKGIEEGWKGDTVVGEMKRLTGGTLSLRAKVPGVEDAVPSSSEPAGGGVRGSGPVNAELKEHLEWKTWCPKGGLEHRQSFGSGHETLVGDTDDELEAAAERVRDLKVVDLNKLTQSRQRGKILSNKR
ncbi:hypothetical protein DFH27DRAFT_546526 [Peziza echinospora]|nr:hypothetical protein DFH27DRAFT_546526 [Peziza echinospora]